MTQRPLDRIESILALGCLVLGLFLVTQPVWSQVIPGHAPTVQQLLSRVCGAKPVAPAAQSR